MASGGLTRIPDRTAQLAQPFALLHHALPQLDDPANQRARKGGLFEVMGEQLVAHFKRPLGDGVQLARAGLDLRLEILEVCRDDSVLQ